MASNYLIINPDGTAQNWDAEKPPEPAALAIDTIVHDRRRDEWRLVSYFTFPFKGHGWELLEGDAVPKRLRMLSLVLP